MPVRVPVPGERHTALVAAGINARHKLHSSSLGEVPTTGRLSRSSAAAPAAAAAHTDAVLLFHETCGGRGEVSGPWHVA